MPDVLRDISKKIENLANSLLFIANIRKLGGSANTVFECDENLLTPCTASNGRRFEYLFGAQCGIATAFAPALALLRVKGAQTVAVFRETGSNELFYSSARSGVIQAAQSLKLKVVSDLTVPYVDTLDTKAIDNMKNVIAQIQPTKADVVVGAVYESACHAFVRAAKSMNDTAGEFLFSVCISNSDLFKEVLGLDGRYVMGPVSWDRRLTGRVYNEDGSSNIHYFPHFNVRICSSRVALLLYKLFDCYYLGHPAKCGTVCIKIPRKIRVQPELSRSLGLWLWPSFPIRS